MATRATMWLAALLLLACLACDDSQTSTDGGSNQTPDSAAADDAGPADAPAVDQSSGDLAFTDQSSPDLASTDSAAPDGQGVDVSQPDAAAAPDVAAPDAASGPYNLTGTVQKGPFVLGSSITVSTLSSGGFPTGLSFPTSTSNNAGEFSVMLPAPAPVSIEGSGYYFDELHGTLSGANLTLRAVFDATSGPGPAHVNLVTHLTAARALHLVQTDGAAFTAAVDQAEVELVAALGVGPAGFTLAGARGTDLHATGADNQLNAYTLALSALFLQVAVNSQSPIDAELQRLVNVVEQDLADDGLLNAAAADAPASLRSAEDVLPYLRVMDNLRAHVAATDPGRDQSADPVPDIGHIIDTDRDGIVNRADTCDLVQDPGQEDADGDGHGDACDFRFSQVDVASYIDAPWTACALHDEGSNAPAGTVLCFSADEGIPSPHTHYSSDGFAHVLETNVAALTGLQARDIAVQESFNCARMSDGSIHCWDGVTPLQVPDGFYVGLAMNRQTACGMHQIGPAGQLRCWTKTGTQGTPINGRFTQVSVPERGAGATAVVCAMEVGTHTLRCFLALAGTELAAPSVWPPQVSAVEHSCAVQVGGDHDGKVVCWVISASPTSLGNANPASLPDGPYVEVGAGCTSAICGVHGSDGRVECDKAFTTHPYGEFVQVDVQHRNVNASSSFQACGLTAEGWVRCFGNHYAFDDLWTPW